MIEKLRLKLLIAWAALLLVTLPVTAQELTTYDSNRHLATSEDWLVSPVSIKAQALKSSNGKDLVLYNGLLKRTFRLRPNMACVDFINLSTGKQLLRAVREEGRIVIDGKSYNIGGLYGQKEKAYLLPQWLDGLTAGATDFKYVSYSVSPIRPFINWDSSRFWSSRKTGGTGIMVSFLYKPGASALAGLEVSVNYELFDGMPLMVKSITVVNKGNRSFKIERVVNEVLGMVEEENSREGGLDKLRKPTGIYFETNYAFNNAMNYPQSDQTTHWKADTSYSSQVNGRRQTPVLLEAYPEKAPGILLEPGEVFSSVRTHEMLTDSEDRERRGMAIRRLYGAVAPWTSANPIFMHLVSRSDEQVYTAIDQCAATGYEAVILSFGSHLNMENMAEANLSRWKGIADYAHKKNIRIGGYSLFSSRSIGPQDDVIDPVSGKPNVHAQFEHAPCFGSNWGLAYRDKIKSFYEKTGFDIWENDGPYPGDVCASTTHPGHKGLEDSQWRQIEIQKELYRWLNERGVYINSPDWYFLDGTHKIAMGYNESNFKLSREQQKIINRQNIYDCFWEMNPSMSWGMVPLTEYGGGELMLFWSH
ncbi:alpha-galactosidase [Pedobacter sp. UC225_61]|uniref:alpha-galactosidase n=1 Tax=Pedobacter sp. UC225_61 TaxID=3374623 RepID=UPI00379EFC45